MSRQRNDRLEPGQVFEGRNGSGSTPKIEKVDLEKGDIHFRETMGGTRGPKMILPIGDFLTAYRLKR